VRGRLILGAVVVAFLAIGVGHFFIRHSLLISQNWVNCNEGACHSGYVADRSLVNAEHLSHYCAAYDTFTDDISQDIARSPGTMRVAFKPDPQWDRSGGSDFVTEALIPADQATAQRAETDAEKVPRACAKSLSVRYFPVGQYQPFTLLLTRGQPGQTDIEENVAIADNGKYLIVAKDTGGGIGPVSQSAVQCTLDGGPVTSTKGNTGTRQTNCRSSFPW
jgi:hypothetical protein